jgi:hypothetical protein
MRRFRLVGAMALVALALSGCSSAPVSVEPTPVAFRACQVSEKNTDSQADSEQITYALQKAKIANGITTPAPKKRDTPEVPLPKAGRESNDI